MADPFVHVELMTGDVDKAKAFYGALFDGNLEGVPGMNYTIVKVGEHHGMMAAHDSNSTKSFHAKGILQGSDIRIMLKGKDPSKGYPTMFDANVGSGIGYSAS